MKLFRILLGAAIVCTGYGYAQNAILPQARVLGPASRLMPSARSSVYRGSPGIGQSTYSSETVDMENFPGADCGAKINNAYAALSPAGGTIAVHTSCSFSTPVIFGTGNKVAVLQGSGAATTLTYTGSSGAAITYNNGRKFDLSTSLRDIVLTGPGNASSTVGVVIGGANGCVGCAVEHSVIQGFGTGLLFQDNQWITQVSQSMLRDNGVNVLLPSGMADAGENVQFDHVTFADAPAPHANSVWVQGGGQEVDFTNCSFDQAQLRVGNGTVSAAQVSIEGTHFENPNYETGVSYDYITVDDNNGNFVRITDSYFLQDNANGGQTRFAYFGGGKIDISGIGVYTPAGAPLTNFAVLANAVNVDLFSFNDLSGNIKGPLLGGSTTGYVSSIPGANTASNTPGDVVFKSGDPTGGAALDITGNIRSSSQIVSLAASGTAPLVVNSTTPVNNLFANPLTYMADGTQVINRTHLVYGRVPLSSGTATVTLGGAAAYSNANSYRCTANDETSPTVAKATPVSGASFTLTGTGTDNVSYICIGQ